MNFKRRLVAIGLILCFLAAEIYVGFMEFTSLSEREEERYAKKQTIRIWYADETLTDYINSVALEFYHDTDIRVVSKCVSGSEYLEAINDASLEGSEIPDLYIVGNDSLGKAYLAGLASTIQDKDGIVSSQHYEQVSLDAVTFEDQYIGYPFYFETSYLLYNKTYLESIAKQLVTDRLEGTGEEDIIYDEDGNPVTVPVNDSELAGNDTELAVNDTEEAADPTTDTTAVDENANAIPGGLTEEEFNQMVESEVLGLIPSTIDDILNFANAYDAPENVDTIFKWDVSDIFYNYFFIGKYAIVGGDTGDDSSKIDIYNQSAIKCLTTYQKMNQFFSIDADTVDYQSIIQEFEAGKNIFTVATTDAIATLEAAKASGDFIYDYGVLKIPSIDTEMQTRSLSVTNTIVINGYSNNKAAANKFAKYLCYRESGNLYGRTGKVAARKGLSYENSAMQIIQQEYADSISMPKMLETSNYWIEMELCFTKAWQGEDVNQLLKSLSEEMKMQITGTPVTEEVIIMPVEEEEEIEDTGM